MKPGDKVKINVDYLNSNGWEELREGDSHLGKDYVGYIQSDEDKVYTILEEFNEKLDNVADFVLNDTFLGSTSFREKELILVTEV